MTTKRILNCFILLIICCSSAFAQVGDSCTVKSTGVPGICKLSSDCPIARDQAQNGISPTICGFYQLTVPIVCCEPNSYEPNNLNIDEQDNSEQNNYSDVLVYPDNINNNNNNNRPERPPPQTSRPIENQYAGKSEQKCQEYSKFVTASVQAIPLVTHTEAISLNVVKCDYNGVALIVGGKPASPGEFPFMAAIGFYSDNKVEWRCGGTLISEEYVLTAAHCTFTRDGDTPKIVRLGDLDLSRDDEGSVHSDYNVRDIIVHPRYRYPRKYNDIALIQLSTLVKFTKFIRPACLYTKSQIEQPQAIATGWGKTDYAAAEISEKLMKVSLNIYDNDRCAQTYQVSKHLPQGIKDTMICAGELSGGMDTCQGDSGGPLLITKKGNQCQFYVIGITSFGKSCGQANTPAIYTKVSEYVPWIEKIIW